MASCGKYGPPVPPEELAPKAVEALDVAGLESGVSFTWKASDVDRRGKELKFSDGFSVMRKEIKEKGDESNPDIPFEEVAFLQDDHVDYREILRKEARDAGKVGRRIEAPDERMRFAYIDNTVQSGSTYMYRIVPMNQDGAKGAIASVIKVEFKGAESDVKIIDAEELSLGDEATEETS